MFSTFSSASKSRICFHLFLPLAQVVLLAMSTWVLTSWSSFLISSILNALYTPGDPSSALGSFHIEVQWPSKCLSLLSLTPEPLGWRGEFYHLYFPGACPLKRKPTFASSEPGMKQLLPLACSYWSMLLPAQPLYIWCSTCTLWNAAPREPLYQGYSLPSKGTYKCQANGVQNTVTVKVCGVWGCMWCRRIER